ncbi:serine/threonine-protein kinase [Kitasatospora sp. NBC_01287]|uniref:WD40 repeat domain-containing serine/threonine protein kinase n=1 Tax=Kitasatospora sp. NBC_01287 TaxID=2903573 RepID=UPI0022589F2F|nr:serine/threonine-protein kinase [Kitasatospora sp. NBC_01287]MCX4746073.1 serine/threonine-protein kinase [Kitasatospora sp. NBC_01287]
MVQALQAGDPREVGGYQLLGRLGQGRLGQVFLGRSRGGRLVALRVVAPELAADARFRDRFRETVTSVRAVSGFYVAQVVDAGPDDTPLWLAGAYIPGPSLAEAVAAHGPLPHEGVRVLGAGLAEALEAVHAAGLLHRDLTPGNVILAGDGPRVTDFALAHAWDEAHPSRTVGAVSGSFLAPEQIRTGVSGTASDVFALGGLLVFAVTGNPPFGRDTGSAALHRIVAEDPDLSGVPAPLLGLVSACLTKNPDDRPRLQEIRRQLAGSGSTAWLPSSLADMVVDRQADADARNRVPGPSRRTVLALAGAGTLAAVGVPVGLWLGSRAGSSPQGRRVTGTAGITGAAGGHGRAVQVQPLRTMGVGAQSDVHALAFSPDGTFLASGTDQGQLNVFRDPGGQGADAVLTVPEVDNSMINSVAFSRTNLLAGSYMLPPDFNTGDIAGDRLGVTVWEVTPTTDIANFKKVISVVSGTEGTTLSLGNAVALSPDGRLLALGRSGRGCVGKVQVWEVGSGKLLASLVVGPGAASVTSAVMCVAFSPDGGVLAAGYGSDQQNGVQLWDTASFTPVATFALDRTELGGVLSLSFSADGRTLVGSYGGIAIWDMTSHTLKANIGTPDSRYEFAALSPDGTTIAVSVDGQTEVTLWDLPTRTQVASVPAGRGGAKNLAFSPDGKLLAATTQTTDLLGAVELWRVS